MVLLFTSAFKSLLTHNTDSEGNTILVEELNISFYLSQDLKVKKLKKKTIF